MKILSLTSSYNFILPLYRPKSSKTKTQAGYKPGSVISRHKAGIGWSSI